MDSIRLCLIRFLETKKRHFFTKWIWVGCLTIDLHRVARVSWWLIKERRAKVLEIGTGYISRRKDSTINVKNWKELARETNVWRITPLPPQARTRRPIWAQKEPVCVCVTKIDTTREKTWGCVRGCLQTDRPFWNRQNPRATCARRQPSHHMVTGLLTSNGNRGRGGETWVLSKELRSRYPYWSFLWLPFAVNFSNSLTYLSFVLFSLHCFIDVNYMRTRIRYHKRTDRNLEKETCFNTPIALDKIQSKLQTDNYDEQTNK